MDAFLRFAKAEARKIDRDQEAALKAAEMISFADVQRVEREWNARIILADELRVAADLVKGQLAAARKLNSIGALQ